MQVSFVQNMNRGAADSSWLSPAATAGARAFHRQLPGYAPTPLVSLDALARELGVAAVLVKDESQRFGLNAFKGLGGSYAMFRIICDELGLDPAEVALKQLRSEPYASRIAPMTFVTATDGNHGRGVAWAARLFGCSARVLLPQGSAEARAAAIRDAGATSATITELGYDDCVREAARLAAENGWHLLQDTSWEGYEDVPRHIIQGYTTIVAEAAEQLDACGVAAPTHVLLQAGVGAFAGAVTGALAERYGKQRPVICTVEPREVACVYESVRRGDGAPHDAIGSGRTIMAGLNCAEPCTVAWPVLNAHVRGAFACDDELAREGMRLLAHPREGDPAIVSGESGAVTAGLLARLLADEGLAATKRELGLDESSVVLLVSTEGDTDPVLYRAVVG